MTDEPLHIVGLDIAKDKFDAHLSLPANTLREVFPNTPEGVAALVARLIKPGCTPASTRVCIEAAGVYSRPPCALLHAEGFVVHLENPAPSEPLTRVHFYRVSPHPFADARACAVHTGLTPKHRQSGKSVRGKPGISRRGDPHIRHALYMPSMCLMRHEPAFRARGAELASRGLAGKAVPCALMRKLAKIAYGIITRNESYDPAKAFPTFAGRLT